MKSTSFIFIILAAVLFNVFSSCSDSGSSAPDDKTAPPPAWNNVGDPGFSDGEGRHVSSFVFEGTPYVAYSDEANGYKVTVKKYNGSNWETVGSAGFSAGQASYISPSFLRVRPMLRIVMLPMETKLPLKNITGAIGKPWAPLVFLPGKHTLLASSSLRVHLMSLIRILIMGKKRTS